MVSEKEKILRWFYREVFPSGTLEFDYFLSLAVHEALNKSKIDTESYVQSNKKRHWNALLEEIEHDKKLGRTPLFKIIDITNRSIIWFPYYISYLKTKKEKQKAIKIKVKPYMIKLIDNISERQYEALCCVICELAGAKHVKLTPSGNEGGIDFFAIINTPGRCHVFNGNNRPLRIIGQAKKYYDKVQVNEIKEFITTVEEVKNQNPSIEHLVPPWFRTSSGPILGWYVAHNGVQSGGITKARNQGIIISDTIDIAEIATLSRKISLDSPEKRSKDLIKKIDKYLQ